MTASLDPRTPVLVGVGQISNRVDRGEAVLEPVDLMAEALRRAQTDSGAAGLLAAADSVRVILQLSWRYRDPGALIAERIGAPVRESLYTVMGGNYVGSLVNRSALDILEGRNDVVLVTGGEAWRSRSDARKADDPLPWTVQGDDVPAATPFGHDKDMMAPHELERGIFLPVQLYPIFDNARRAAEGLTPAEHLAQITELWSRFSEVAATNPYAWTQQAYTAEELATAGPDNRMVGFPYTKRLNSNNMVEQGAALVLCSVEKARALGVPEDRWVFLHGGADASDTDFVSNRDELHASPAIRTAGAAALELAGVGIDDLAHIDLYSCFPAAVAVAARELGLDLERQLTVTGGMTFAGGPWNNYTMHGIATMAGVLREDPGAFGLCTGNGGYLTKHSFGVWSTTPPAAGTFRWRSTQDEVDAQPTRELDAAPEGAAEVESYTVMHDREGAPEQGILALRMPDGRRAWGLSSDAAVLADLVATEAIGRKVVASPDGAVTFD